MPTIKLHQPIEGKNAGETVEVDQAKADFYLTLGYASKAGDKDDKVRNTGPKVEHDLTLAENREAPDEDIPASPDVVPAERGSVTRNNTDVAKAQKEADKDSEKARKAQAKEEKKATTNSEVQAVQEQADKDSEKVAGGFNDHDQPGEDEVPVEAPAEPAV